MEPAPSGQLPGKTSEVRQYTPVRLLVFPALVSRTPKDLPLLVSGIPVHTARP